MKILTVAEMREVDRLSTERYGIPSLTLMENAGRGVADFLQRRFSNLTQRPIVILCGKGNNGGDGFVAARHLIEAGAKPAVFLFAAPEEIHGDAAANFERLRKILPNLQIVRSAGEWLSMKAPLQTAHIIVDALLGTGVRGPVEGLLAKVIEDVNRRGVPADALQQIVVAVDIPSGLNADTGEFAQSCIGADETVTFTAPKIGMFRGKAELQVGKLVVHDIGSPRQLVVEVGKQKLWWMEAKQSSAFAIPRKPTGHKGDYGHALIVAGSVGKSGAAVLASWAALRAGAGLVTVAIPEPVLPTIAAHTPEVMTEPLAATRQGTISERCLEGKLFETLLAGKRALAIGPGLGQNQETQQFIRTAVASYRQVPIILDADGLNAFASRPDELKSAQGLLAITPHPGEMARLVGRSVDEIQSNRLGVAIEAAARWNAVVVLKGHHTVTASPHGEAYINTTGNPGMGTGGTGDVLTGILAGLVAQFGRGLDYSGYAQLTAFGVYLHGLAGDLAYAERGEAPLMASDLIHALPRAYQKFFAECGRG
jgi:ADP-dependent NAD(P)H-hydrate dehydratase / NAD(P)H-hydrate epimerase